MSLDVSSRGLPDGLREASSRRHWAMRTAALLEKVLDVVTGAAVATMAAVIAYQVFGRYVLDHTPSWSEELARYLMVWLTMLGSAAVLRGGGHIAVTTLIDILPAPLRRVAIALRDALLVCACGILGWWGLGFARLNATQESPAMEIPMSIPYAALPVGASLIVLLVLLTRLAGSAAAVHGEEPV